MDTNQFLSDGSKLPILIAAAVIFFVFAIGQVIAGLLSGERRKIKERLTREKSQVRAAQEHAAAAQPQSGGLSGWLARRSMFQQLNDRLMQVFPGTSLAGFLGMAAGLSLLCFLFGAVVNAPAAVVMGAIGWYLPFFILKSKRKAHLKQLSVQLPEALDFLSRILRAGHSLSTGIQMMGEELPAPLCHEFRRCYTQNSLGQSLDEALRDMARQVESTDFAFFVTAVLIQRQTGGDLSEVLTNISSMIRQRIRLQQHVKAKTAEGRLTGYILVAFPAIMFGLSYALNPAHAGTMLKDSMGIGLLITAVILQFMGMWAIRRITTLKV